jgi:short-subunit dehydrogenase
MADEQSKAVLITGCSSGIGHATAKLLADEGRKVYATARRVESIEDLKQNGCETLALDVTEEASMQAAVSTVEEAEGAVGVLINNAGYSQSGAVESVPLDEARSQFETNVFGLTRMCQLVLPGMRRQGWGKIVNLSSMGGKLTFPGGGHYHATKHAVEALSDALRFEVKGFGVDVIVIEPGLIKTEFGATAAGSLSATSSAESGAEPGTAETGSTAGASVYSEFNATVAQATVDAYEGGMAKLGGGPETVARKIQKAINARRPRTRYTVTPLAKILLFNHALLSDRMWDRFVGTQYPRPGKD